MLHISKLLLAVTFAIQVRGNNIIKGKPSRQTRTYYTDSNNKRYYFYSKYANDGTKNSTRPSMTHAATHSYWQGDLLGFYTIQNITITSDIHGYASYLRNSVIGVSVHDVTCSDGLVTKCGQWPDETLSGQTLTFNCTDAGPVRFVRVWHEGYGRIALEEVEVDGEPSRLPGITYDKYMLNKVTNTISSVTVAAATGCGTMCHKTQPCIAFKPNCLLATDVTMRSDVNWVSYKVRRCFGNITCDLTKPFN